MNHGTSCSLSTASQVLALDAEEVAPFVRNCLFDRSLSWVVSELNNTVLNGAAHEKEQAQWALVHLGFI